MKTLRAIDIRKTYDPPGWRHIWSRKSRTHVLEGISLEIQSGRTVGLVGESGCGKSTTARILLGLVPPSSGRVELDGRAIGHDPWFRGRIQVVFQDASAALNPRKTVAQILRVPLLHHRVADRRTVNDRIADLLTQVGLTPPEFYMSRFPHELSGGQQQRVVIARALTTDPDIIIADEPVSNLDVSVRAQILELLKRLQEERNVGYLLISHDLAVVRTLAHTVVVMYLGRIVESGPVDAVFDDPQHPYTKALLDAVPVPDPDARPPMDRLLSIGEAPSVENRPPGCAFHPRCPAAVATCRTAIPALLPLAADRRRSAACRLVDTAAAP